ncbi:MAG: hypothetical protein AAFX87_24470 [Bacteroidota bacterium]
MPASTAGIPSFGKGKLPLVAILIILLSCTSQKIKRETYAVRDAKKINAQNKYLKVHMKDGYVYVLDEWSFNDQDSTISGFGKYLDINRSLLSSKKRSGDGALSFKIAYVDVALLETNDPGKSNSGGLVIATIVTVGLTINCIINPKSCFGSCPTFYADTGEGMELMAEGFSSSVAPSLEAKDIDMLYNAKQPPNRTFNIEVTNEAYETHVIRHANLIAVPKDEGKKVFVTPDEAYWEVEKPIVPQSANAPEGDISPLIERADGKERFSLADSTDLAAKEEVVLTFDNLEKGRSYGLILGKRQTLLTTYIIYQGLAYMGHGATYFFSEMERKQGWDKLSKDHIIDMLGGVEIFTQDEKGAWQKVEEVRETGPIATDFSITPVGKGNGQTKVKLRMTKGLWRLDYVALAPLVRTVDPIVIEPVKVLNAWLEEDSTARQHLINPAFSLVTLPGDKYTLVYQLPESGAFEFFLDSQGYYLEWMRNEWLKEQNLKKVKTMFLNPSKFLRKEAPKYKRIEHQMEEVFWNSRYVKN